MKVRNFFLVAAMSFALGVQAFAAPEESNVMDEFDPASPDAERILDEMDAEYERSTGNSAFLPDDMFSNKSMRALVSCYQKSCPIFLDINKSTQTAELYENGVVTKTFKISSGTAGHRTPNFDTRPNGRIYDAKTSGKYPGGNVIIDGKDMGNMPYAVFISGGYAVHGTKSLAKLGTAASHGCIRMHPDNAKIFNRLVRANGIANTWITVHN